MSSQYEPIAERGYANNRDITSEQQRTGTTVLFIRYLLVGPEQGSPACFVSKTFSTPYSY